MDQKYNLENADQTSDNNETSILNASNSEQAELYKRYLYYTRFANRNRRRVLGAKVDPAIIAQIRHIFNDEREQIEIDFSRADLEQTIYKSIRINNL